MLFRGAPILAILLAATYPSFGQTGSLALSSATLGASRTVSLNLTLTSPTGNAPAAIQWTLTYPASAVTAFSATAGTALTSAGKTLTCVSGSGTYKCLATGMNTTVIPNGLVAVVSVTLAASATSASIGVTGIAGASPSGGTIALTSTGGAITGALSGAGPTGVVAAYAFSEGSGTTTTDASGNGTTGILQGATWTTSGKFGGATSFNGSSSYIDLGNPASLQATGSMTWSAWVNAAGNPPDDGQIIAQSDGTSGWQFKTSPDTGVRTFAVVVGASGGGHTQRYSKTVLALNTWYHVAGVYNASARTLDIYVNGVLDNGVLSGTVPSAQVLAALSATIGKRSGGYYFNGRIDNLRIYNRALSAAEIQTDMNTPADSTGTGSTVTLQSMQCSPASVVSGGTSTCTVTVSPAPMASTSVTLSDNSSALTVPASVSVGAGATTASFTATAGSVMANQAVTVTASLNGSSATAGLTITPVPATITVSNLACSPTTVASNGKSTCTVTLSSAPTASTSVAITDNSSLLSVPASATVAANAASASFTVTAGSIPSAQTATITATLGSSSRNVTVSLVPLTVVSVTVSTASVVGGNSLGVTVTLSGAAPSGGASVSLSGSTSAFPSTSVTVPAGATSQTFTLPTATVTAPTVTSIRASYNGSSVSSSSFTVNPATTTSTGAATFVKTDVTTLGSWKGVYGGDGFNVINDTVSYPTYVTATPSGYSLYSWAASTSDPRGLQKSASATDREAACWCSPSSLTIDLAFKDTLSHQVAVYLVDWDNWFGRVEQVDILDSNNKVLDTRVVSSFSGGQYLVWNLSGHVVIRVTNLNSLSNAVLSGVFFGGAGSGSTTPPPVQPPPPSSGNTATFVSTDVTTAGSWKGVYGGDGYNVINDTASYPAYVTVTPSGNSLWTWSFSTNDVRALQKASSSTDRIAASWYSSGAFTIDLAFKDNLTHKVALYLLDFDLWGGGRTERVDILDPNGTVLSTRSVMGFGGGQYLVWNLSGHVVVRITNTNAASNAAISGLFFGGATSSPPPSGSTATFVKTDNATVGTWKGAYGADGYNVINDTAGYPTYVTVTPSGNSPWTWSFSTNDVRALQKAASSTSRIAACWYAFGAFTIDLAFKDNLPHQVAIYLLDYDQYGNGRTQQVDILDGSGKVLDTRLVSGFSGGRYLVWNLSGHVVIRFTNTNSASNAVLSGIFFR